MTQLVILTDVERRRFDRPQELTKESRRRLFYVTSDVRLALARIEKPANKVGFLLQFGYFKAGARFYSPMASKRRDIEYVQQVLTLEPVDLTQYAGTVMRRHRQMILALLNWQTIKETERVGLVAETRRYVANQEHPKEIFRGLVDSCWKHQWMIPSYHDLAEIITHSFNEAERKLMSATESALTPDHVEKLELLLKPIERVQSVRSTAPITALKVIDQSLRPSNINPSMETLTLFRDHFMGMESTMAALPLSDKATEYYANWLRIANHQQLTQFPNRHKVHLHLLAFIKHQFFQRQDAAISVLLKSVTALRTAVRNQLKEHDEAIKKERDVAIQVLLQARLTASEFASGVMAVVSEEGIVLSEKYYKIESLAADYCEAGGSDLEKIDKLEADIACELNKETYYALLESMSPRLQRRVNSIAKTVVFDPVTTEPTLMAAIRHFKDTDGRIGSKPPTEFLSRQERAAAFRDGVLVTPLYKCLLFIHMADGVKSGGLNLNYSYIYRSIQDYLIPLSEWQAKKSTILEQTGLAQYANGVLTLSNLKHALDESYRIVNKNYQAGDNSYLFVNDKGRGRVQTPKTDFEKRKFITTTLAHDGIVPILQLLKSVNRVCEFTSAFKHFSNKHSKMAPTEEMLMAGILANGCNIGIGKLAKISTGIPEHQLHNTVSWYFNVDNLRKANDTIVGLIKELALANNYLHSPPTIHSASDGRKMNVAVDCLHASYSYKYHGNEKGVTDYVFIDERQALTHAQVFTSSDREAPYVIDGLMANPVPAGQSIHSTDTHGYTEQIFGATHLLGIAFAPRIKNIVRQRTYAFSTPQTYRRKGYDLVPSRTINQKLILENWDDILRFIASIKTRYATASQLFKRLSSYAQEHPLYKALKEFGRIIKSQFIMTYFDDLELRQQIQKQLSRVEQAQKFSKAVFFDRDRAFQDGTMRQQESAIVCKLILQNAIVLWNYLSLSERIIDTPDPDERRQLVDAIGGGSVIAWEHVNLRGEYDFTHSAANDTIFDIVKIKALRIE